MLKGSLIFGILSVLYYLQYRFLIFFLIISYNVLYPQVYSKINLYYKPDARTEKILKNCKSLRSRFFPTIWLFNGVLQAIFEATVGDSAKESLLCAKVSCTREEIILPDGGLMSIDWEDSESLPSPKKILVIGPGLTGHTDSEYIRGIVIEAIAKKYKVAILLGRGIGGNKIKTFRIHNVLASDDFGFAIQKIKEKYPNAVIVGIGASMGAGLLLKYAADSGEKCLLKALAIVATPFNHLHSSRTSEKWWPYFKLANKVILKILKNFANELEPQLKQFSNEMQEKNIKFEDVYKASSYYEFDSAITAKMHGLKDATEYYQKGRVERLDKVKIPLFALSSLDDPIIDKGGIPYEDFEKCEGIVLATTTTGGHVGWFKGNFMPKRWFQTPCLEFLDSCLE